MSDDQLRPINPFALLAAYAVASVPRPRRRSRPVKARRGRHRDPHGRRRDPAVPPPYYRPRPDQPPATPAPAPAREDTDQP